MRLYSRKNTKGEAFLWVDFNFQGKRYRKSLKLKDTAKNRKIASTQIIPEIQVKLNNGKFIENEKQTIPTVSEYKETSFEIHKVDRRILTQKHYESVYKLHIEPYFADKKLDKIKSSDLARWQNKLLETRAPKTVKVIRTVFQTMLEDAMYDEIIATNPFSRVKSPKLEEVREKKPFSKEEMFTIINAAPEHMKCFFACGFFGGFRTGELIGLKWEDVDWEEKIIKVRRSRRAGHETLPKTKNSIRDVEILDALFPYLIKHRELVKENSIYIFETYKNKPYDRCDKIGSHYWKRIIEKVNLEYRNLYQMRHSFASLMISMGEDILWVSNMLGHKDSSMTLQKYARYVKVKNKKRAAFLLE